MGEKVSACLQFDIAIEEFWKFCVIFKISKGILQFVFCMCGSVFFLFYRLVVQSFFFTKQIVF